MTHNSPGTRVRIHIPGLPHNDPVRATEYCAFAQRIRRLTTALHDLGHEVYLYAGPDSDASCTEHVEVIKFDDRARWFGDETWTEQVFDRWDPDDSCWTESNTAIIRAIGERLEPGDIIGITAGRCQAAIADAFPAHLKAELFAGYEGIMPDRTHICFESEAWRHYQYGRYGITDGRFFDAVIPNFFDPDEFALADKKDYLLYLGRMTPRKGLPIVAELARVHPVVTAGQGDDRIPYAHHVGVVTGARKRDLLARARAVLVPSQYVEPFGGVAVEAMLSGTPVITTDFGAFTETVEHGVTGFRCRTLAEFRAAVEQVDLLDPAAIRKRAVERFSTAAAAPLYDGWLGRLATLYDRGWYQDG